MGTGYSATVSTLVFRIVTLYMPPVFWLVFITTHLSKLTFNPKSLHTVTTIGISCLRCFHSGPI
jgi:hypothetical protein